MTESTTRPSTRTYVAIAFGCIAAGLARGIFGNSGTVALVSAIIVVAIFGSVMIWNRITKGVYLPGLKKNQSE